MIILATPEAIPLITVCNRFPDVEATVVLMIDEVEVTPFTLLVNVFVTEESVFPVITELVEVSPFILVVRVFPEIDCEKELIMFVTREEIPFTIVWKVLVEVATLFEFIVVSVVLEITPFTLEVIVFELVVVARDKLLLVDEATKLDKLVEVDTPFTVLVSVLPLTDNPLLLITDVVATTPLIVVVRVLPDND